MGSERFSGYGCSTWNIPKREIPKSKAQNPDKTQIPMFQITNIYGAISLN
jgi:hypothetical protein